MVAVVVVVVVVVYRLPFIAQIIDAQNQGIHKVLIESGEVGIQCTTVMYEVKGDNDNMKNKNDQPAGRTFPPAVV